ncbi:MAG: hypothetical protein EBS24_06270 [Chitinophagia bacterium]|jgi:hypothetical protein|nr:hypothetical protein [Chitinophagia bacterium]
MQLFISLLISLNFISHALFNDLMPEPTSENETVIIKMRNADKLDFEFSMKYEENREVIKIRSSKAIKSLRTVETASNSHKGYNVMGSDLIILPQRDFSPGSYIMEVKFMESPAVLIADMHVLETPVASGN